MADHNIKLGGDFSGLDKAANKTAQNLDNVNDLLNAINRSLVSLSNKQDVMAKLDKVLMTSAGNEQKMVAGLRGILNGLTQVTVKAKEASDALDKLNKKTIQTKTTKEPRSIAEPKTPTQQKTPPVQRSTAQQKRTIREVKQQNPARSTKPPIPIGTIHKTSSHENYIYTESGWQQILPENRRKFVSKERSKTVTEGFLQGEIAKGNIVRDKSGKWQDKSGLFTKGAGGFLPESMSSLLEDKKFISREKTASLLRKQEKREKTLQKLKDDAIESLIGEKVFKDKGGVWQQRTKKGPRILSRQDADFFEETSSLRKDELFDKMLERGKIKKNKAGIWTKKAESGSFQFVGRDEQAEYDKQLDRVFTGKLNKTLRDQQAASSETYKQNKFIKKPAEKYLNALRKQDFINEVEIEKKYKNRTNPLDASQMHGVDGVKQFTPTGGGRVVTATGGPKDDYLKTPILRSLSTKIKSTVVSFMDLTFKNVIDASNGVYKSRLSEMDRRANEVKKKLKSKNIFTGGGINLLKDIGTKEPLYERFVMGAGKLVGKAKPIMRQGAQTILSTHEKVTSDPRFKRFITEVGFVVGGMKNLGKAITSNISSFDKNKHAVDKNTMSQHKRSGSPSVGGGGIMDFLVPGRWGKGQAVSYATIGNSFMRTILPIPAALNGLAASMIMFSNAIGFVFNTLRRYIDDFFSALVEGAKLENTEDAMRGFADAINKAGEAAEKAGTKDIAGHEVKYGAGVLSKEEEAALTPQERIARRKKATSSYMSSIASATQGLITRNVAGELGVKALASGVDPETARQLLEVISTRAIATGEDDPSKYVATTFEAAIKPSRGGQALLKAGIKAPGKEVPQTPQARADYYLQALTKQSDAFGAFALSVNVSIGRIRNGLTDLKNEFNKMLSQNKSLRAILHWVAELIHKKLIPGMQNIGLSTINLIPIFVKFVQIIVDFAVALNNALIPAIKFYDILKVIGGTLTVMIGALVNVLGGALKFVSMKNPFMPEAYHKKTEKNILGKTRVYVDNLGDTVLDSGFNLINSGLDIVESGQYGLGTESFLEKLSEDLKKPLEGHQNYVYDPNGLAKELEDLKNSIIDSEGGDASGIGGDTGDGEDEKKKRQKEFMDELLRAEMELLEAKRQNTKSLEEWLEITALIVKKEKSIIDEERRQNILSVNGNKEQIKLIEAIAAKKHEILDLNTKIAEQERRTQEALELLGIEDERLKNLEKINKSYQHQLSVMQQQHKIQMQRFEEENKQYKESERADAQAIYYGKLQNMLESQQREIFEESIEHQKTLLGYKQNIYTAAKDLLTSTKDQFDLDTKILNIKEAQAELEFKIHQDNIKYQSEMLGYEAERLKLQKERTERSRKELEDWIDFTNKTSRREFAQTPEGQAAAARQKFDDLTAKALRVLEQSGVESNEYRDAYMQVEEARREAIKAANNIALKFVETLQKSIDAGIDGITEAIIGTSKTSIADEFTKMFKDMWKNVLRENIKNMLRGKEDVYGNTTSPGLFNLLFGKKSISKDGATSYSGGALGSLGKFLGLDGLGSVIEGFLPTPQKSPEDIQNLFAQSVQNFDAAVNKLILGIDALTGTEISKLKNINSSSPGGLYGVLQNILGLSSRNQGTFIRNSLLKLLPPAIQNLPQALNTSNPLDVYNMAIGSSYDALRGVTKGIGAANKTVSATGSAVSNVASGIQSVADATGAASDVASTTSKAGGFLGGALPWIGAAFGLYSAFGQKTPKVEVTNQVESMVTNWPEVLKRGFDLLPLNSNFRPLRRNVLNFSTGQFSLVNHGTIIGANESQVKAIMSTMLADAIRQENAQRV